MDEIKFPPISKKFQKMVPAKPEPKPEPKLEPKLEQKFIVEDTPPPAPAPVAPSKIVIEDIAPVPSAPSVPTVEQTEPLLLPQTLAEMEAGRRALERYNPVLPQK